MNKDSFISTFAGKSEITKKDAEKYYDAFIDTFVEGLGDGVVDLTKFLKVEVKPTPARKGRNPLSGVEIDIPAGQKLSIKPLKKLKEAIGK